ncbi:MAG: hypothetical protein H7A36_07955 [Chlamydiales bacterium]|nr:hypothetical protein [Chlamydiales bacterium]
MREKCQKIVYGCFIFEIAAAFIIGLALAACRNSFRISAEAASFSPLINSLCLLLAFGVLAFVVSMQLYHWKDSSQSASAIVILNDAREWYIPLFMLRSVAVVLIVVIGVALNSFNVLLYFVLIVMVCYFAAVLFFGSYTSKFANICLLIGETTALYSIAMAAVSHFATVE